jgi:predicted transcriptional regulator
MTAETTTKTTVYLPTAEYRRLQALAEAEGRSTAELLREAVREYAQRRTAHARPLSIGAIRVNRPDLSERTEELLEGFGA